MQPLAPHDPMRIGPYRTVAELGRGAMGRVLLAYGPDDRWVAVKLVRDWLVEDREFRARFRREVAASRRVSGSSTAAVVDAGPDDAVPWLASEFLPGPTLQEAVDAAGALPEQAVLRLAAGLASALVSIHEAGVIHRDLKPGNVILTREGPRVIDFGIARAVEQQTADLTRTGGVIGTPGYMSPEQAESAPLTTASDVFSLGSVLVLAATGSGPFDADSTLHTLNNVVRAEPDLSAVPERVREIARGCLARDPTRRPTATELLAAVGPVPPEPWPEAVVTLTRKQHRELTRILEASGQHTTRIDSGSTMVTDPEPPTRVDTRPGPSSGGPAPERTRRGTLRSSPAPRDFRALAVGAVAILAVALIGVLLSLSLDWEPPEGGDGTAEQAADASEVAANGDWVPRFQGEELELPSYVRYGSTCFWGVMDLDAENPMPVELDGETPGEADLAWGLCPGDATAWEGAEPCDLVNGAGCLMRGEVLAIGDGTAAVVSGEGTMDAETCGRAAESGGAVQDGDEYDVRWDIELAQLSSGGSHLFTPEPNGMCIDTGEELFFIEFGDLDYDGRSSVADFSINVYVDSWTPRA
ncbi:serine/threonine-protein kinase [Glycomyces tenuis]|uniref:serine/threonine-protein kinase n=1 Tax=Glycomyces tenuis TaxID=58116 RepID=UPI0009DC032B|nr:serine/threonine-protein kinase [Glycomyces tenuis]